MKIKIIGGDDFTGIYINGELVMDYQGSANEGDLLRAVLDKVAPDVNVTIDVYGESEFDSSIWIDGEGYVKDWATVEKAAKTLHTYSDEEGE